MKKQIVVIHGGDTFENYETYIDFLRGFEIDINRFNSEKTDWKPWLRKALGSEYEVLLPAMPNKTNAQYGEWKMWMDKLVPFLNDGVILIGHSLGGAFLVKYLSQGIFPKKIRGVFLVAAVYDKDTDGYPLASFALPLNLDLQTENIYLYHSKDDPVVPFSDLEEYKKVLPNAQAKVLNDRKHINQEEFPELVEDIKSLR